MREGDGANSPTQATKKQQHFKKVLLFFCVRSGSPQNCASHNLIKN
jgi:hypothetical protein